MSHDFRTAETVVKWVLQTLRGRLKKGREVLLKNPWVNVVAAEAHGGFGERGDLQLPHWRGPVEICKLDQCMYGLTDVTQPDFHIGSLLGCCCLPRCMKEQLSKLCDS